MTPKPAIDGLTDILSGPPKDYVPVDAPYERHPLRPALIAGAITLAVIAAAYWAGYGVWFAAGVLAAAVMP